MTMPPAAALATSAALPNTTVALPSPRTKGEVSLEHCLLKRRSVRNYRNTALSLADISQLLWAAQGMTAEGYLRTAPSAGALYPLEIYLAAGNVDGLSPGLYHYQPERHGLVLVKPGDLRCELARAALGQDCAANGAAISCSRRCMLARALNTVNAPRGTFTWKPVTQRRMYAFRRLHEGWEPSPSVRSRMTK